MNRSRLPHRLFSGIAGLSLALFILAPIAWLGSEGQDEGLGRDQSWVDGSTLYTFEASIEWCNGMLMVERHGQMQPNVTPIPPGQWAGGSYPRYPDLDWDWFTADPGFVHRVLFPQMNIRNGVGTGFYLVWHTEPYDSIHLAQQDYAVAVPLWLITILSAIVPAIWLRQFVRRRGRELPGHCKQCGYDLRASNARCPECGAAIAK